MQPVELYAQEFIERIDKRDGTADVNFNNLDSLKRKIIGFTKGELVIIGARTSQGKTSFITHLVLGMNKKTRVLFVSLEMRPVEMVERMVCSLKKINKTDMLLGKHNQNDQMYHEISEGLTEIENEHDILLSYGLGLNFNELQQMVKYTNPKPDIVIVDYVQAIKYMGGSTLEQLNEYIRSFRQLAGEMDFVGVLVSQVNRSAENAGNIPTLGKLKGTGVLEEHADLVVLLHWDYFYKKTKIVKDSDGNDIEIEADRNKFNVIVAKNRNGMTGACDAKFYPEFGSFSSPEWYKSSQRVAD